MLCTLKSKMSACCISGCKNRASSSSSLKFYRIPSGSRPFQANRRRLWLQAIQQATGSTEGLKGNVRVCGAHFISGKASMDHGSVDFVPSIFTKEIPKKKAKWVFGRRKRRRRKVNADPQDSFSMEIDSELSKDMQTPLIPSPPKEREVLEKTETETEVNKPKDTTSPSKDSISMEIDSELSKDMQTPLIPSPPKEREVLEKTETETEVNKPQDTTSPSKTPSSLKIPPGTPDIGKMSPIVLLKPIVAQAGGYRCELCSQTFICVSQLLEHRQQHEKPTYFTCDVCQKNFTSQTDLSEHQQVHIQEPSFPCNMCNRSFTSVHHLKRHKLLHVKDGRKCRCGVLLCQQHGRVLYLPMTTVEESDDDWSDIEPQDVDINPTPINSEPDDMTEAVEDPETPQTTTPPETTSADITAAPSSPNTCTTAALHNRILSKMLMPKSTILSNMPHPPVPRWKYTRKPGISVNLKSPMPDYPATFVQPHLPQEPHLPESLQLFSPQCLTSALLDVKRNYDYILHKQRRPVKLEKDVVKVEKVEPLMIFTHSPVIKKEKNVRIAYDIDTVI